MTHLLDGNALVALALSTHTHHRRIIEFLDKIAPEKFATCSTTQGTLIRLHMQLAKNRTSAAAWYTLKEILSNPRHTFWENAPSYENVGWGKVHSHADVTDAWLAQLVRHHQGKFVTFDEGLARLHPDVAIIPS